MRHRRDRRCSPWLTRGWPREARGATQRPGVRCAHLRAGVFAPALLFARFLSHRVRQSDHAPGRRSGAGAGSARRPGSSFVPAWRNNPRGTRRPSSAATPNATMRSGSTGACHAPQPWRMRVRDSQRRERCPCRVVVPPPTPWRHTRRDRQCPVAWRGFEVDPRYQSLVLSSAMGLRESTPWRCRRGSDGRRLATYPCPGGVRR